MTFALLVGVSNGGSREWLADRRLFVWGTFAAIAFITHPDPTNIAPTILTSVMVILFEATLLGLKWTHRGPNRTLDQGPGDRPLEWKNRATQQNAAAASLNDSSLDRLRQRYAAGNLTDEQFERKLDQLRVTKTLETILTSVMVVLFEATLLVLKWIYRGLSRIIDQGTGDQTSWWMNRATQQNAAVARMDGETDPALAKLRQRYAAGDLTDEQFERKLERLLETETLEISEDSTNAREWLDEHDR